MRVSLFSMYIQQIINTFEQLYAINVLNFLCIHKIYLPDCNSSYYLTSVAFLLRFAIMKIFYTDDCIVNIMIMSI